MNNAFNLFFVILLLLWVVHVPGTWSGDATNRVSMKFALRDTVADRPVVRQPLEKNRESEKGTRIPQGQGYPQKRNSWKRGGETSTGEFVPSEEIEAGQAVDFPADI
jgi:hypothetical protein